MPIVDVDLVETEGQARPAGLARALADRLGAFWGMPSGRVWVRLSFRAADAYAENGIDAAATPAPVFATILHAHLPDADGLAREAGNLARTISEVVGCHADRVHVVYAPPGAGRVAFGGALVR
ncbi:MAG: hypothetical protein JNK75_03955 [Betaproteobacteria bacterium]|nr:hypothetical protein [Betaproteobacteria bacterium]